MSRDVILYLEDIQIACEKISRFTAGMTFQDFIADDRTYDAVLRNLEVIGEASRNISAEYQQAHPIVEWRAITALRNIVAHEYFGIKDEIIWDVVQNKIPSLGRLISTLLGQVD